MCSKIRHWTASKGIIASAQDLWWSQGFQKEQLLKKLKVLSVLLLISSAL